MRRLIQSLAKRAAYRCGFSLRRLREARGLKVTGADATAKVRPLLHRTDPYAGFPLADHPADLRGWGGDSPAFAELVAESRPERIIEVGTWLGASALSMASALRAHGIDGEIICVDTWLGALEFWTDLEDPERHLALRLEHGYPTVYRQFLANVLHAGMQDVITPFPLPSFTAAQWFSLRGIRADLIYIDGSHEEEDVLQDLEAYAPLLRPGGCLFGDDWSWDGVRLAVQRFASDNRLTIRHRHDKWELRPSVA